MFTEDEAKIPGRQTPQPRAVRKTSLACAVRTLPVVSLAATRVDNYTDDIFDLSLFNSLSKLLRVVAYVKRFFTMYLQPRQQGILRHHLTRRNDGGDDDSSTARTKNGLFRRKKSLETMPQVKSTSKILKMYPILFQGVLCVDGRLAHDWLLLLLRRLIWIHHTAAQVK